MKIGFAQLNTTVGDLRGNQRRILDAYRDLAARGAGLVLTPELALTGYPPQDLVFKSRFVPLNLAALDALHREVGDVPLIVGFIDLNRGPGQPFHNAAAVLQRGQPIRKVHKSLLPTYDVFDEDRYFKPAPSVAPVELGGISFGITICEDIWTEQYLPRRLYGSSPIESLIAQGATVILNLSAELKPDQLDQDTLPPYEILDPILQCYVEEQLSTAEIIARGFDEKTVRWVVRRVDLNEYKRAQAVPGLKVTGRAFGLGRRMPVAQRFAE